MGDTQALLHEGKRKGKHKGKNAHALSEEDADVFAMWKGKGKNKSFSAGRPPVNAYSSEIFYGLEMKEPMNLHATSTSSLKPGCALLDCGATASASREESVKNLISAIVAVDRGATVQVAKYMRPFFVLAMASGGKPIVVFR